jgi:hypothetical protein
LSRSSARRLYRHASAPSAVGGGPTAPRRAASAMLQLEIMRPVAGGATAQPTGGSARPPVRSSRRRCPADRAGW